MAARDLLRLLGIKTAPDAEPGMFSQNPTIIGGGGHYVFHGVSPRLSPGSTAYYLQREADGFVSKLGLRDASRFKKPGAAQQGWSPYSEPFMYRTDPIVPMVGENPHISFFLAADELRLKINEGVTEVADGIGQYAAMVTVVYTPITAIPLPEQGYRLVCEIGQFVASQDTILNANESASLSGEVPVTTPDNITFKYLLLMQEELKMRGMLKHLDRSNASAFDRRKIVTDVMKHNAIRVSEELPLRLSE